MVALAVKRHERRSMICSCAHGNSTVKDSLEITWRGTGRLYGHSRLCAVFNWEVDRDSNIDYNLIFFMVI